MRFREKGEHGSILLQPKKFVGRTSKMKYKYKRGFALHVGDGGTGFGVVGVMCGGLFGIHLRPRELTENPSLINGKKDNTLVDNLSYIIEIIKPDKTIGKFQISFANLELRPLFQALVKTEIIPVKISSQILSKLLHLPNASLPRPFRVGRIG
jgi:hypothetical protein